MYSTSNDHPLIPEHRNALGSLWMCLHSLETALRIVVSSVFGVTDTSERLYRIHSLPVGEAVELDPFTNYNQLSELIAIYNAEMERQGGELIDREIIMLRHALAHGRVSMLQGEHALRLIKFSKPAKNDQFVRIEYSEVMTKEWFEREAKRVRLAISSVTEVAKKQYGYHE